MTTPEITAFAETLAMAILNKDFGLRPEEVVFWSTDGRMPEAALMCVQALRHSFRDKNKNHEQK